MKPNQKKGEREKERERVREKKLNETKKKTTKSVSGALCCSPNQKLHFVPNFIYSLVQTAQRSWHS